MSHPSYNPHDTDHERTRDDDRAFQRRRSPTTDEQAQQECDTRAHVDRLMLGFEDL